MPYPTCTAITSTAAATTAHTHVEAYAFDGQHQGRPISGMVVVTSCNEGVAPTSADVVIEGRVLTRCEPTPLPGADDVQQLNSILQDAFFADLYAQHPRGSACSYHR